MTSELKKYLSGFVTERRLELFNKIIEYRTRYISVALEDIYQPHNASAVLRTCDCFGIQDVHVIENRNLYEINPDVALGASNWLNLHKYNQKENNTLEAVNLLKSKGYRIVATTPHTNHVNLEDFDLTKGKVALFFGTEQNGLSKLMLDNADEYLKIPMYGFTESFNISVSASIILNTLSHKLRNSELDWKLTEQEREQVFLDWLRISLKDSENIEKIFYERELWKPENQYEI